MRMIIKYYKYKKYIYCILIKILILVWMKNINQNIMNTKVNICS